MTERERLAEIYYNIEIEYLDYLTKIAERAIDGDIEDKIQHRQDFYVDKLLANGVIVPPCKVGDWIWYVYRNEINKAKVEEITYDASKHGYYSYNFSIYAYDFKNKRQVTYHPINETTKNKSNINGVEGMDFGEDVFIFLTKEEAEQALRQRKEEEGK